MREQTLALLRAKPQLVDRSQIEPFSELRCVWQFLPIFNLLFQNMFFPNGLVLSNTLVN